MLDHFQEFRPGSPLKLSESRKGIRTLMLDHSDATTLTIAHSDAIFGRLPRCLEFCPESLCASVSLSLFARSRWTPASGSASVGSVKRLQFVKLPISWVLFTFRVTEFGGGSGSLSLPSQGKLKITEMS